MTLDDAIEKASIILPEHRKELAAYLKNLPDGIEKWLYRSNIADPQSLYQGDVLINLPTCFVDEVGDVVKGDDVVALISNTCDMQPARQDFIIASPIVSFDELKENEGDAANIENLCAEIRGNKIFRYFYLPAQDGFPESCIDFSRMVSINSTFLNSIKRYSPQQCVLSLSQNGFYFFLIKLTFHFARMEKPSVN
jgi:hypothetical protein